MTGADSADVIVVTVRNLAEKLDPLTRPEMIAGKTYIVLALNDLGFYNDFGGLMDYDGGFREYLKNRDINLVYIHCEPDPWKDKSRGIKTKLYPGDDRIVRLTMPMGYISGSKVNISYEDNDQSAMFRKRLEPNVKNYNYNWSWMGTESVRERTSLIQKLYEWADKDTLWTNMASGYVRYFPQKIGGKLPGPKLQHENILVVSKPTKLLKMEVTQRDGKWTKGAWEKQINADNKLVPYDKYLRLSRETKVNISLNGLGMWCYKDAEMFAYNCFCLRESHKNLNINPLSPTDGKHWVVFDGFDDLVAKIKYYTKHNKEREKINDAGHNYFKDGISGGWAKVYTEKLRDYLKTKKAKVFDDLLWKGKTDGTT